MSDEASCKNALDLTSILEQRIKKVHTQSLDLSFNELMDMHKSGELDISPDYQRLFQWSEGARSRFIETLLLEMPVPAIYVIEDQEGKYLLIDGLQRISSYLHFRGQLSAPHFDPGVKPGDYLTLRDCDIVQELNGKKFNDLPTPMQIRLKRSFVRVEVIRKGSDPQFKYHMFKRLNTGGTLLTEQQLRNCTIRLLDPKFNDFIIKLSKNIDFILCTETVSDDRRIGAYDQELILRFFALSNNLSEFTHDVADFLTDYMENVSVQKIAFNFEEQQKIFEKTFAILAATMGERSFAYASKKRDTLVKGFSVYHYEAFTVGLQNYVDRIDVDNPDAIKKLETTFCDIKYDNDFIKITTGGGKNSPGPLNERIDFVKNAIDKIL